MDWNLYGHQLVTHLVSGYNATAHHNAVDGDAVPVPESDGELVALNAQDSVDDRHSVGDLLRATDRETVCVCVDDGD